MYTYILMFTSPY
ncbi:hypothetical protein MTR67_004721, partial [Solanum verrucosum]